MYEPFLGVESRVFLLFWCSNMSPFSWFSDNSSAVVSVFRRKCIRGNWWRWLNRKALSEWIDNEMEPLSTACVDLFSIPLLFYLILFYIPFLPGGIDSPPEPAPSDLPMRMNGGLRPLKPSYGDMDGDSEHSGYHIQPGSGVYLPQGNHYILILFKKCAFQVLLWKTQ